MRSLTPLGICLMLTVVGTTFTAWYYHVDFGLGAMCVALAGMVFAKTMLAQMFTTGYGVLGMRGGVSYFRGQPLGPNFLLMILGILGVLCASLVRLGYVPSNFHPSTVANLRCFGWCLSIGWLCSVVHWFVAGRYDSFFGNEYDARVEFAKRGMSPEEIEQGIQKLREGLVLLPDPATYRQLKAKGVL